LIAETLAGARPAIPEAATVESYPRISALTCIAEDLRGPPRPHFKTHLKQDLTRRFEMTTSVPSVAAQKVRPLPEGTHNLQIRLPARNAAKALEFYRHGFGATELYRLNQPDGRIGHAEFRHGDSVLMLADEFPDTGAVGPETLNGTPALNCLYVEDVDGLARRAIEAGAKVIYPVHVWDYGDRAGRLQDPFGHLWMVCSRRQGSRVPEGYHTATPGLAMDEAAKAIDFDEQAFGASEVMRYPAPDGKIAHAEIQIGNSRLMLSDEFPE
jgi:PhnB protein